MNGRSKEQHPLPWRFFQKGSISLGHEAIADLLRQHAGFHLTQRGEYVGHDLTRVRPKLETLDNPSTDEQELLAAARVWIGHADAANLAPIKLTDELYLSTPVGISTVGQKIRGVIDRWVAREPTGRRKALRALLSENSSNRESFGYICVDALVSISLLREQHIVKPASPLGKTLGTLYRFLSEHALPLTGLNAAEIQEMTEGIVAKRLQPQGARAEYVERAKKLLQSHRFKERYHALIRGRAEEVGLPLLEEVMREASVMNRVRLMEQMEDRGIDFIASREAVDKLLHEVPAERPPASGVLSAEYISWFQKFVDTVAPISNMIFKMPHDTAYMLEQVLRHNQGSCVGRAYALEGQLRAIGLDTAIATNKYYATPYDDGEIDVNPMESGEHVLVSVRLPHGILVSLDPSLDPYEKSEPVFSTLLHNATIHIPTGEVLTDAKDALEDVLDHPDCVYLSTDQGFEKYQTIGKGYSVMELSRHHRQFSYFNYGFDIQLYRDYSGDRRVGDYYSIPYALGLEIMNFPKDSEALSAFAEYLLTNYKKLATIGIADGSTQKILQEAAGTIVESGLYSPYYMRNFYILAQIITIPDFYQGVYEEQRMFEQADGYFDHVYRNPVGEISQQDLREKWISILESHPEHVVSTYGSLEGVQEKIRELRQKDMIVHVAGGV